MSACLIKCKWAETIESPAPPGKDFVFKDWQFDFRDFAESYHACIQWYSREVENSGNAQNGEPLCPPLPACNPARFTPFAAGYPTGAIIGNGSYWASGQTTTPKHYDYNCCLPAVFVQPNSPGPCNGVFVQMPPAVCYELHGSLWMGRVDQSTSDANSCPNYIANRNAGVPNPPTCEPQLDLSLFWHPSYNVGGPGVYELFVAPPPPTWFDLDIDSDNNNEFALPKRTAYEDWLEDQPDQPGKVLWVHDADSDGDGIPDYADGFNLDPANASDNTSAQDRFVPLVLEIPSGVDLGAARLRITYSASDPAAMPPPGTPPVWEPAPGHFRLWKVNGDQPRGKNSAKAAVSPGDYVEPGDYSNLAALGFVGLNRTVTVYVEAVRATTSEIERVIRVELDPEGDGVEWEYMDLVRVSTPILELDMDSDNNNAFDLPARDDDERAVKQFQLQSLPDEERVRYPGKVLMVNDGDVDQDGVPDFADRLDLFATDGVRLTGAEWPECPQFVPVLLQLVVPNSYSAVTLRFTYPESNPANIVRATVADGQYTYTAAPGKLRLWMKDGKELRKVAPVNAGGDYVASGVDYLPSDLGLSSERHTVALYVEAVDVSGDVADLEIEVTADSDSGGAYPVRYSLANFVRPTSVNLSLMNVAEDNSVEKARHIEISQATPVVTVSAVSVTQVQPSADASHIVGTLNLAGTIASAIQDITPISANLNISELLVYLNDSEDPIGTIPVTFTKTEVETSFLRPFPYAGSFAGALQDVSLLEGVNTIRVIAKDPVDGMEGYAEYSFAVEAISPYAQTSASLDVQLTGPLSDAVVNTITATLTVSGVGSLANQILTETAADSDVFSNAGGTFLVTIRSGGEALDAASADELYAVATASALGVADLPFPYMQETANDTKLFHQSVAGGTMATLDVEMTGPLSATTVDTMTASLAVPGTGSVVDETLTETAANSRVFANAAQTFQITLAAGGETLDSTRPDEIHAVVTTSTLGVTEMAFPFMQETGNATKVFHKDVYSNDEYVADYTGFTFALSQTSQVGASHGGIFNPYVLQVQGPNLFLQHLQSIELDDGPRLVEQSPIDLKYYVKMKNSPTLVAQVTPSQSQPGEPNDLKALEAMYVSWLNQVSPQQAEDYGFARGIMAGTWDLAEGVWKLGELAVVNARERNLPRYIWRMAHGDFFETERRSAGVGVQNAKKFADISSQITLDQLKTFVAVQNGFMVDPNDLSPYNIAVQDAYELIAQYAKDLKTTYVNDHFKRGYYNGRVVFEIVMLLIPETKAGNLSKLTKADFLTSLRARPFFSTGKGKAAFDKLAGFITELGITRFCFVAGTKVHTDAGLKNIEQIVPGDTVLSRDEATGEQAWKPVLETFITHPSELFDIHYVPPGQPAAAGEKLTATSEHPFYVSNRPKPGFVTVRELQAGDKLRTAEGGTAIVTKIIPQEAVSGEQFTTYNFAVQDFQTYFVGESGVWVHNLGKAPCDKILALITRYERESGLTGNALKKERFNVLTQAKNASRGIEDAAWGRTSADIGQKMLDDYAAGGVFNSVDELPNYKQWKEFFSPNGQGGVQIHHVVEKYIQGLLGMPSHVKDLCPGIPLPANKAIMDQLNAPFLSEPARMLPAIHRGMDNGGIADILRNRIPPSTGMTRQGIIFELREIYTDISKPELNNIWPAARDWLRKMQQSGHLEAGLVIPD